MPLTPAILPAPAVGPAYAEPVSPARLRVPGPLLWGFAAAAGLGLLTVNGALTATSLLVLGLLFLLLWRPGEPPVLLFAVGYQWVQVSAKIFHADLFGVPIEYLSESPSVKAATWLSLAGLAVLAIGIWLVLRRLPPQGDRLAESARHFDPARAFWLWAVSVVVTTLLSNVAWSVSSLTQILLALVGFKWAPYFWLAYLVFQRREGYAYLALAFVAEFVLGIGFFSGFKMVFFMTLVAVMATRVNLNLRTVALGATFVVSVLVLGSVWTVVKGDFRSAGGGEHAQDAGGSKTDQLTTLGRMAGQLRARDVVMGFDPLFRRVAYTDMFAATMDFVPRHRDYGRGELWGTAIRHVLMPRMLFPNKPVLPSDSEVTMAWTGQYLASDAEGTSISIGYMGEAYADFGRVGMFGVILVLGLLWGTMQRVFLRRARSPLVALGFSLVILMNASLFEMASIKLIGGVIMQFLVLLLLYRVMGGRFRAWLGDDAEAHDAPAPGVDYVALAGSR